MAESRYARTVSVRARSGSLQQVKQGAPVRSLAPRRRLGGQVHHSEVQQAISGGIGLR